MQPKNYLKTARRIGLKQSWGLGTAMVRKVRGLYKGWVSQEQNTLISVGFFNCLRRRTRQ
jgi:hypothetical protein